MQTLTVELMSKNAMEVLQELENKHFIRIVEDKAAGTVAVPGEAISLQAFQNWINDAENAGTVNLKEAQAIWAQKRKKLQQLTK